MLSGAIGRILESILASIESNRLGVCVLSNALGSVLEGVPGSV
jgi:hypothetical protein